MELRVERASGLTGRSFFTALALATAIPIIALPLYGLGGFAAPWPLAAAVFGVWVLTGYGHVMSTVWFGFDPDYRGVVLAHRIRMLACLLILPIAVGAMAIADRTISSWLYGFFLVWQARHYGRQNYGILSLAAARDGFGALPRQVGWIINITSAAGAIGMVTMPSIYPRGLRLPLPAGTDLAGYGHLAAIACFALAGALALWLVARDRRFRRAPTVLVTLALSGAFFLPSLLPGGPVIAFWPYAMAHGAQYLIIMGNTSRNSPYGLRGLGAYGLGAAVLGAVAVSLPGLGWKQAYTGVVIWHFLADARLWRLRDPAVRAIVRGRFGFIFDHATLAPAPVKAGPREAI
jgi:hypothetical protein